VLLAIPYQAMPFRRQLHVDSAACGAQGTRSVVKLSAPTIETGLVASKQVSPCQNKVAGWIVKRNRPRFAV
jgi:hypothetical protein